MGWWSTAIMGGDTPLDCLSQLGTQWHVGNENTWDKHPSITKAKLEAVPEAQVLTDVQNSYMPVAAQAAAVMYMQVGARLPESLRSLAIQVSRDENLDGWDNPPERRAQLDQFIRILQNYDQRTPTELPLLGLDKEMFDRQQGMMP